MIKLKPDQVNGYGKTSVVKKLYSPHANLLFLKMKGSPEVALEDALCGAIRKWLFANVSAFTT